jgi:hypothetical protein
VTPRPAAGKLSTFSPPVLAHIARLKPGASERPGDGCNHREGVIHAA